MNAMTRAITVAVILLGAVTVTACKNESAKAKAGATPAGQQQQMPPTVVDVQVVELGVVPMVKTFSGRVSALETSEVRPQVSGIIDEVLFREGSYVKKGQELYRINRDNYISSANSSLAAIHTAESNLESAKANLLAQEAQLAQARADLARVEGLVKIDAISRQMYDQYRTAVRTAQAGVESAKAGVNQAHANINSAKASHDSSRLDMSRTVVRAPISGKIGISSATAGALVSAGQATPLATISRTDMVYVDISQSSSEILRLRQAIAQGKALEGSPQVQIVLEDGEVYPIIGQLALSDAKVDEATGAVTVRAVFPNPDGVLIPGMYVNANLAQSLAHNAVLLPQTAIMRTPQGKTQVYIVNADKKIEVREVKTAGTHNGQWVVNGGLQNGDAVVVMGGAKVKPEQAVEVNSLLSVGPQSNQKKSDVSTSADNADDKEDVAGQHSVMAPSESDEPTESADEQVEPQE
ncbi:efflux RND transporter periplasmic adaptor subunit [Moraxella oblonga]|uniref:efflux RND transporter periplasmic adaptor subunit n=1 Tax=Moraxella oblonga TaxID=200413 RepID=UPI000833DDA2|nr:efflux RND transporter periplasmic adaptor subunit [Moraxella oblonga]